MNTWELVTDASALDVSPTNTFWDHLNTLSSTGFIYKIADNPIIEVLAEPEPVVNVVSEIEPVINIIDVCNG